MNSPPLPVAYYTDEAAFQIICHIGRNALKRYFIARVGEACLLINV
jgi:hypothetical protein